MIHYVPHTKKPTRAYEGFSAIEIPLPTSVLNIAEIHLTKRYPQKDFSLNEKSEMIVRVLTGTVIFHCEVEEVILTKGSTVVVKPNRTYYWDPIGRVRLLVISTPPWTPEQHKTIPA